MAATCSKCGGNRFELAHVSTESTGSQFTVLNCSACGQSLGLSEIEPVRAVLREQQLSLNELRLQLQDIREKLAKLISAG